MKNTRPAEHREFLMDAMRRILDGQIPIAAANAMATISAEIHKSIQQEWEMRVYMHENYRDIEHRPTIMLEDRTDENV